MATAEELLNSISKNQVSVLSEDDGIFVIDGESRTITVPDSERLFGVEGDKDVERKYFQCPKIVGDNIDLSQHQIYVSYVFTTTENNTIFPTIGNGLYHCEDVKVSGDNITFSWLLSGNVFANPGFIAFKVMAKKSEGSELKTKWNTAPAIGTVLLTVPDGEEIAEEYPDIINQLLTKMESVEQIATPEAMQGYVNAYLEENPVTGGMTEEQEQQLNKNTEDISSLSEEIVELNDIVGQMIFNGIKSQASIDTNVYVKAGTTYKITYQGNTAVNCFVKDNIEPYVTLTPNDIKTFTPQASGYLVLYKSTLIDGSAFSLNVETENSFNRRIKALEGQEYHVGTGQEYTSFTDCLKALKPNMGKKTIYVHSGTYDIFNEIGGSDYTLSITEDNGDWESVSVIVPPNTHIIGLGDVVFNFMPTPEQMTKASAHLISPLNVQGSCIIENITINADNCRYGIHDETSGNSYFTGAVKRYKNVVVNKYWSDKTLGNPIPYGCGFDDDMEFSFDNCVFNQKRNTESGQSMAFHNRGNKSNTRININNCVLTGTGKSIKFGSLTNSSSVHDKVFIANTFLENNIVIKNEGDTIEKTNPFDITMVGCSDIEFEITVTNNPYMPKVYSI